MLYATAVSLTVAAVIAVIGGFFWRTRVRHLRALDGYSIEPEALHDLLERNPKLPLYDVRQPLDVLAYSERIPGAKRIAPKEIIANPSLIPSDQDAVIYCTCDGQKTSRDIVQRGLALGYRRIKLLRGGLAAWKAKGYPVEPYKESFRLDTAV